MKTKKLVTALGTMIAIAILGAGVNRVSAAPTNELNPNFAVMTGMFAGEEDNKSVTVTELHPQMSNAVVISNFANAYKEDFTVEFKVTSPSEAEVAAKPDGASAGFFFRQEIAWDLYSGIYVRVEHDNVKIINDLNNANNTGTKVVTGRFATPIAYGDNVGVKVEVKNNVITVSLKDKNGAAMKLTDESNMEVDTITVTTQKAHSENYMTGFAADGTLPTFSDIVMTSGDGSKMFQAYPFDSSKPSADGFKIVSDTMTRVELTEGNEDVQSDDEDIIGAFPCIFYADYDGSEHTLNVVNEDGSVLPSNYMVSIQYRVPPTWDFVDWTPQSEVNRHGISIVVSDADGYAFARLSCAFRINTKKVTVTDVVVEEKKYDGTREVLLSGGKLEGVADGDDVSFDLGIASSASASVGNDIEVISYITLTGEDKANYEVVQPEGLKVNIIKGNGQKPSAPIILATTSNSITVKEVIGAQYRVDDKEWQDSNVINELKANKVYNVSIRMKADDNSEASEASDAIQAKTEGTNVILYVGILMAVLVVVVGIGVVLKKKKSMK